MDDGADGYEVRSVQSSMESAMRQMGHTRAVRSQRRRHTS